MSELTHLKNLRNKLTGKAAVGTPDDPPVKKDITLVLDVSEITALIQILANQPFGQVYTLVQKINDQTVRQIRITTATAAEEHR